MKIISIIETGSKPTNFKFICRQEMISMDDFSLVDCFFFFFLILTEAGEWNEALWKEVSLSLSQNVPFGGEVCTKNIPEDHLSNKKLHVPICSIFKTSLQQLYISLMVKLRFFKLHLSNWKYLNISVIVNWNSVIDKFLILPWV